MKSTVRNSSYYSIYQEAIKQADSLKETRDSLASPVRKQMKKNLSESSFHFDILENTNCEILIRQQ